MDSIKPELKDCKNLTQKVIKKSKEYNKIVKKLKKKDKKKSRSRSRSRSKKKKPSELEKFEKLKKVQLCKKLQKEYKIKPITKNETCLAWIKHKEFDPIYEKDITKRNKNYKKYDKMCKKIEREMAYKTIKIKKRKIVSNYKKNTPNYIFKKTAIDFHEKYYRLREGDDLILKSGVLYLQKRHHKYLNLFLKNIYKKNFMKKKLDYKNLIDQNFITIEIDSDPYSKKLKYIYYPLREKTLFGNLKNNETRFSFFILNLQKHEETKKEKEKRERRQKRLKKEFEKIDEEDISWGHNNVLVYDKKDNTMYRFEPNGTVDFYDDKELDKRFKKLFKKFKIKYKNLTKLFPKKIRFNKRIKYKGPQGLEEEYLFKYGDAEGYCAYWNFYFIDYIITNYRRPYYKDKKFPIYIKDMIKYFKKGKKNKYVEIIRTFAILLNKIVINKDNKEFVDKYI